jgi:hypothetical protein
MYIRPITTGAAVTPPAAPPQPSDSRLEPQVSNGLNLYLPLKSPAQMRALLALLASAQKEVDAALTSLHYVHFARFLPSPDGSALWVITEYDGALESYVMDFVAVLGDVFTNILQFVRGAPRLPVQKHAREFTEYVVAQNIQLPRPWSAYPDLTVIDILRTGRRL